MSSFPTKEERIDRIRAGLQGKKSRSTPGQAADFNILTSIALHALSRQRRGKTLSKLEAFTTGLYDKVAQDDDELDAYIDAVSAARLSGFNGGWLTPATLALGEDEPYTREHFQNDLATQSLGVDSVSPHIPAYCRLIDPVTGERIGLDDASFQAAAKEAGRSTTVYWSNPQEPQHSFEATKTLNAAEGVRVTLKPTVFYCHKESKGEAMSDEIYWSLASGADSGNQLREKQVTGERGNVDTGKWYDFPGDHVIFDGRVKNTLAAHIACWEADQSHSQWYDRLRDLCRVISEKSSQMASVTGNQYLDELVGLIPGASQFYEVLFWTQQVAGLIATFMEAFRNKDDFVAEVYLAWNLPALDRMFMDNKKYDFPVMFDGGNAGKHELWIKRVRQGDNFPGLVVNTLTSNDLQSWKKTAGNSVNGAVAMYEHKSKLWSVVSLEPDGLIAVTDQPLVHDGQLQKVLYNTSPTRADIVVNDNGISLAYLGHDQQLCYLNREISTSASWRSYDFDKHSIAKAPNICTLKGSIICIFYSFDHNHYWMKFNQGQWADCHRVQAHEPSVGPAAACALGDAIYYFYADKEFQIRVAIVRLREVERGVASIEDYGLAPFEARGGISATVWKDQIYIAYSTVNPEKKPCIDRYDVGKNRLVSVKVFNDESCPANDPALGVRGGDLHITYREHK
jgi:hypothetical protein